MLFLLQVVNHAPIETSFDNAMNSTAGVNGQAALTNQQALGASFDPKNFSLYGNNELQPFNCPPVSLEEIIRELEIPRVDHVSEIPTSNIETAVNSDYGNKLNMLKNALKQIKEHVLSDDFTYIPERCVDKDLRGVAIEISVELLQCLLTQSFTVTSNGQSMIEHLAYYTNIAEFLPQLLQVLKKKHIKKLKQAANCY